MARKKIADRKLRQKLGAGVQRLDHQFVILVLIGGGSQITVGRTHAGLELKGGQQFLLGLRKLALLQQQPFPGRSATQDRWVWLPAESDTGLGQIVFLGIDIQICQIELHRGIAGRQLEGLLQLRDGRLVLAVGSQHPAQLHVGAGVPRMERNQLAQNLLGFGVAMAAHVDVGHAGKRVGGRGIESESLLVLLLGVGKAILIFQQRAGR